MIFKLNKHSSRQDVYEYINTYNKRNSFTKADIEELLVNLTNLQIDTYIFSIGANLAAKTIDKSIVVELEKYLMFFWEKEKKNQKNSDKAFCAYYLLTYYYRIYEKMDKLSTVITLYQDYFEQRENQYALAFQIRGRYLRRRGDGSKALDYDRKANELLKKKNIDNIQVKITNASTVSIALENREDYITENDVEESINVVKKAIVENPEYAKYHYLLAKLKIFFLLNKNDNDKMTNIDYVKEIKEAKESLRTAIELEDIKADSYNTSISEYKTYLRSADLALAEIRLTRKIKTEFEIINSDTANLLNENKNEVANQIKKAQDKYLEILALFVSIVAIIMVVIGSFSNQFSTTQILVLIIGMCIGVLIIYSAFLIMLHKEVKVRYILFLLLSFVFEGALLVSSILWL